MLPRNTIRFNAVWITRNDGMLHICPVGSDDYLLLEFNAPASFKLPELSTKTAVFAHCAVNANSGEESWYAFQSYEELQFFRTLMEVDRMGPKSAFKVLNVTPWEKISALIEANNREGFKKLKGIPEKTAEDIVALVFGKPENAKKPAVKIDDDAIDALRALGWTATVSREAVERAQAQGATKTEEIIKACLKK
jgi:Holliday junction DNA helicase RuvA